MIDLDGFLKLNEAQRSDAQAEAGIAVQLADIPQKLAQADLTEAQAVKQQLQNVQILQVIDWDARAEDHLLRMRTKALQDLQRLVDEADKLRKHILHVGSILRGGSDSQSLSFGWLSFAYLRDHSPVGAQIKGGTIPEETEIWFHPTKNTPQRDPKDSILVWAAKNSLYPKQGTPAFAYLCQVLQVYNDGCVESATVIQQRIIEDKAIVDAIQNRDWDRLKVNHQ